MSGITPDDTDIMVNKNDLTHAPKEHTKWVFGFPFYSFPCKNHSNLQVCILIMPIKPMGFLESRYKLTIILSNKNNDLKINSYSYITLKVIRSTINGKNSSTSTLSNK